MRCCPLVPGQLVIPCTYALIQHLLKQCLLAMLTFPWTTMEFDCLDSTAVVSQLWVVTQQRSPDQWVGHIQAHESWWCVSPQLGLQALRVTWSRLWWKSANNTQPPGLLFVFPQRTSCHTFTSIPLVITITSLPCPQPPAMEQNELEEKYQGPSTIKGRIVLWDFWLSHRYLCVCAYKMYFILFTAVKKKVWK